MRSSAPPSSAPSPAASSARRGSGTAPPGRRDSRRPASRPGGAVRPAGAPAGPLTPLTPPTAAPAANPAVRPLPPHVWFAGRLLDVLTGRQPLTCLAGRVRDEAYQRLWELHAARADWRRHVRGRTPYVYRCRPFRTADGALEVAAVVALDQDVFRALAFRLEPGDEESGPGYGPARWRCTAVAAR
ncbi:Rv3235 family protein [Streptomyces sp. NBC_01190]|uniref:Rv3235 family protein n=1 Tax=Streptomyces sp. NBC_01190 TaxID=2903767 RepID=UPI00386AE3FB|nr:Rv3235 family protein [Streptomyces sp. NBC_01190]